ncbi:MAG: transposase [SAR324 cluster bacterium]|nr:transposase [SAR324 cluster bacterium]
MQNPSDPDAGYDGHKGQGYQVQIAETYRAAENEPALSLITHVAVESAAQHDSGALIPAIEGAQKLGLPPKKALADTAYGSAENHQQAAKLGVELIAPVPGKKPQTELSLADFSFSDDEKVSACPQGQVPFRQSLNKKTRTAFFTHSTCDSCSKRSQCPVLDGKKGRRLCYDSKQLRNARRRAFQATPQFQQDYRFPAGVEAAMSQFDRRTGVKQLRVRGFKTSLSVLLSKPPELTSSGLLRSATAKTAAFQTRARLAFFTLCTLLRRGAQQVPRQALRSSGANPAFDRSHSPIALSLRKRGALSYCGTITPAAYLFHASFKEAR